MIIAEITGKILGTICGTVCGLVVLAISTIASGAGAIA